jgi:hypothetical protein
MINHAMVQRSIVTRMAVSGTSFTVNAGALGFVSTDVSSVVNSARLSVWMCYPSADQNAGVRDNGSTVDTKHGLNSGVHGLAGICKVSNGLVEFYRAAANNVYYCVGYVV